MVLLRVIYLMTMILITESLRAADLDTLLSNLAAPKAAAPAAPAPTPGAPVVAAPKTVEPVTPVMPKVPAPIEPKIAPVVAPVMPKVPVSPVMPPVGMPQPVEAKVVGAPEPTVAKAKQEPKESSVQMQITDIHEVVADGLDTLHIDNGGNWLEKRIWYKKAEQLFEEMRATLQKTADARMKFIHVVNQVGQQIDDFYENAGFQKGQIDELLQAVSQDLTTEQDIRGGDLSSDERAVRLKIQAEQTQFQTISKDFKLIEDLDDQVDKTLMKAFKEIDACRALETKAWNNFKEIGLELDDKKARVLYYEMENFNKNIEQKLQYLQGNLFQYLQGQLVPKVTQTISQIQSANQLLQTKGLQLVTLLQKDQQGDFVVLQQRDVNKAKSLVAAQEQADAKKSPKTSNKEKIDTNQDCELVWYKRMICSFMENICCLWENIVDCICIVICCAQSVLCKIQEMICHLMGY